MTTHITRAIAGFALAIAALGSAWFGTAIAHAGPFDQKDFPCQEDEVLGYAPQFGPDHVGCMHVEVSGHIGTKLGV